ncbi:MAG: hypothetical protein ACFWTZ_02975 [Burkholderia sp.]|jgi:homoserine/homoserine lactone efflux protein
MTLSSYSVYLLAAAAVVATPGPGVLMSLLTAARWGYRGAIWAILGTACGTVAMAGISMTGVGLLLAHTPAAYDAIRVVGALYMIYLGIRNWRVKTASLDASMAARAKSNEKKGAAAPEDEKMSPPRLWLAAIGLQFANPLGIMFFISFLPQFVDPGRSLVPQFLLLALSYAALVVLIHSAYALALCGFRAAFRSAGVTKLIYRIGGTVFIVLGLEVLRLVFLGK